MKRWLIPGLFIPALFLMGAYCNLQSRIQTELQQRSLSSDIAEEVVVDYLIVTPFATSTMTPTPTLTPTAVSRLPVDTLPGSDVSPTPTVSDRPSDSDLTPDAPVPPLTPLASPTLLPTFTPIPPTLTATPTFTPIPPTSRPPTSTPIPPPAIDFAVTAITVNEADGSVTLAVNLSWPFAQTITVDYTTVDQTAVAGSDYDSTTGTLTFVPNQTTQTITVPLIDDNLMEPDETFGVVLSNPANASLGLANPAQVTILDDDILVNVGDDMDDGLCNFTHCSLREAINAANAKVGVDTIAFDIPPTSTLTIQPTSALPNITEAAIIDGLTQPGADCSGWPPILLIELNGGSAGAASGLNLTAGGSTVQGLMINGFANNAIVLSGAGGNQVTCNYIGTDQTGTTSVGNGAGVFIDNVPNNIVGGAGNLISGNSGPGISISGLNAVNNVIEGNTIGADASGINPLGNDVGIEIVGASNNTVGGATGNVIAYNNLGVTVIASTLAISNRIQANAIFTNTTLGIDLVGSNGVDANDGPGDLDTGPNNLQNYPALTGVITGTSSITITGMLTSTGGTNFTLELFANQNCHPSGYGEGEQFLGTINAATNITGTLTFTTNLAVTLPSGQFITATATDPAGNTSEFSACRPVP